MDAKQRIEVAKQKLKRAEQAKITAEAQKAAAEKQRDEVVAQMAAEGVTPETIQAEIAKLETEVNDGLAKVEQLIPNV
jgi:hypothetical protein